MLLNRNVLFGPLAKFSAVLGDNRISRALNRPLMLKHRLPFVAIWISLADHRRSQIHFSANAPINYRASELPDLSSGSDLARTNPRPPASLCSPKLVKREVAQSGLPVLIELAAALYPQGV
ncbi:predicted protein [Histoplasma capsulatum H143]|uniref:Uncharacterized protein n=1 Tax=Ajellomyces capsulatus (strain H143) TaxID=544712 RepID=C6HEF7_AJECH|nr:predicted protein [Histoplasma capsulatum H143]